MVLDLGWSQGYEGLKYHMEEAYEENGITHKLPTACPDYAIFSHTYYNEFGRLDHTKKYDYCFIGSIDTSFENRQWVIDFAKANFTTRSIFLNTDALYTPWESLGEFDYSHTYLGFAPKRQIEPHVRQTQYRKIQENLFYFQTMCQSRFVLCPAGDSTWSFRFYETIMCKSLPIVASWHHTYRSKEEASIPYKYILNTDLDKAESISYDDYVQTNTELFRQFHLL